MSTSSPKRIVRYFVSYAHADGAIPKTLLAELKKQLDACKPYTFQRWEDSQILVGEKWHKEIQDAADACDFGLLLVSPSFLGSKYITDHELPRFVRGDKPCMPVALCRIDFENQELKGLEATQIFGITLSDQQSRAFADCTTLKHKRSFAEQLFGSIVARLDKLFAATAIPSTGAVTSRPSPSVDEAAFRAHIRKHYRHLQLEALGGGDPLYRDIDLQQVFIPQDARDCHQWLPERLEGPADLTLKDADLALAELHEHKRFRESPPRRIYDVMDSPAARCRVLLGAPGSGKSSFTRVCLLRWLAEKEGDDRPLPVLIELRLFHRSLRTDFLDYLEQDKDVVFRFPREALHARLQAGTAELLFDGLDEIFDPAARETIARLIARYAGSYPESRILVTSRLVGYPGRILREAGFMHWLLADFDDPKISAFLDHWTTGAIREPGDRSVVHQRMHDALENNVIRELAGNPLLLTLMAVLARKSDLPRDLGSLYARAADLLLEQWDTHRMLASDVDLGRVLIDQKDKHDLLRDLAWTMQTGQRGLRGNLISEKEVRGAMDAAFEHRIPDPGMRRKAITLLIEKLVERNYILCHVGGAQFAFVHRGFLEFFASEYLVNIVATKPATALDDIGEIYRLYAEEDAWQEVLILAATRFDPGVADGILLPLLDPSTSPVDVGYAYWSDEAHPFVLACSVLRRAREPQKLTTTVRYIRSALEDWIKEGAGEAYSEDLVSLLSVTFIDDAARALLVELAKRDGDADARRQAVASLAHHFHDHEGTRPLLVELAQGDEDTLARRQAVASLADHFSEQDGTRALLEGLARREEDTNARSQAVASLADHFSDQDGTRALLVELAQGDEGSEARRQAVASLAHHFRDHEGTRALLVKLAQGDEDTDARRQAVSSLAYHFRDHEGTRPLLVELARREEDTSARSQAVASLADHFGDQEGTRALLVELSQRDEDTDARRQAVASLPSRFLVDEDTRALLELLARRDENTRARRQAVASLAGYFDNHEGTRALLVELAQGDEDSDARRQAVASLANHFRAHEGTHPLLVELALRDEDTSARRQAVASLAHYFRHLEGTHPLLVELARRDEDTSARCQSVASLATFFRAHEGTHPLLVELARHDQNASARRQAVESLAEYFSEHAGTRALLIELAQHDEVSRARQ